MQRSSLRICRPPELLVSAREAIIRRRLRRLRSDATHLAKAPKLDGRSCCQLQDERLRRADRFVHLSVLLAQGEVFRSDRFEEFEFAAEERVR